MVSEEAYFTLNQLFVGMCNELKLTNHHRFTSLVMLTPSEHAFVLMQAPNIDVIDSGYKYPVGLT